MDPVALAPFPVAFSVPSADALLTDITRGYASQALGGGVAIRCSLWHLGTNTTFQVQVEGGCKQEFMLRICPAGWRTHEDLLWEMDILAHLSAEGVRVARPLPRRDGSPVFALPAPEGPRLCVLFALAPGREVGPDAHECRLLGEAVARLHQATDGYIPPHERFALDLHHLLDEPLAHLSPFLRHRPDDLAYVLSLADRVREQIGPLAATGALEWGVCHGDIQGANAFLDTTASGDVITLFDFDCGGMGWRAYDVAVFRWIVERFRWDESCWTGFLEGYRSIRQLSDADQAEIPWLVAAREIWLAGMHTEPAAVARWGYDKYRDRYFDHFLQTLHTWDEAHLR